MTNEVFLATIAPVSCSLLRSGALGGGSVDLVGFVGCVL